MQRKLAKNLGKDSHVRTVNENIFQKQSTKTFEIMTGEVFLNQPEPVFNQNAVTVSLSKGGQISGVPLPGAFIDPITGNLHGSYDGPISGQMVSLGFVGGNSSSPIILNKHPYQGKGNTLTEGSYLTPMFLSGYDPTDVLMGHFSGSVIGLYTGLNAIGGRLPGSIGIDAFTSLDVTANTTILLDALVSAEVSSAIVTLTGSAYVELNGNTNFAVKYTELKTAFDLLRTELNALITAYNAHIHVTTATVAATATPGVISPTVAQGVPATADMSAAQNTKVLM